MKRLQIAGFKSVSALIASFTMYMMNIINEAIIVLVFLMFLVMLSGIMRSFMQGYEDQRRYLNVRLKNRTEELLEYFLMA